MMKKEKTKGDLVISTSDSNAKNINFMAKYGRGLICLALDTLQAKRLNLSLMSPVNQSRNKTALQFLLKQKKELQQVYLLKIELEQLKLLQKKMQIKMKLFLLVMYFQL